MGAIARWLASLGAKDFAAFIEKLGVKLGIRGAKEKLGTPEAAAQYLTKRAKTDPGIFSIVAQVAAGIGLSMAVDKVWDAFKNDVPEVATISHEARATKAIEAYNQAMARLDGYSVRNTGDGKADKINGEDLDDVASNYLAMQAQIEFVDRMAAQLGGYDALRNLKRLIQIDDEIIGLAETARAMRRRI